MKVRFTVSDLLLLNVRFSVSDLFLLNVRFSVSDSFLLSVRFSVSDSFLMNVSFNMSELDTQQIYWLGELGDFFLTKFQLYSIVHVFGRPCEFFMLHLSIHLTVLLSVC